MAINIMSLQCSEATLIRNESAPVAYRINADKVKADLQKARDNGNITDLLKVSGKTSEDVNKIKEASSGSVMRVNNYSVDSFFRKDMPKNMNQDGTYMLEGVSFTKEELEQARNVMKTAVDSIGAGIGKNVNLDYKNYAEMALAENAVNSYAKESFNEEQQAIIARAMKEYNAGLVELQNNMLSNGSYINNNYGALSDYYGLSHVVSEDEAAAINRLKEEIRKITGETYAPVKAGDAMGTAQIATNKKLIQQITDIFQNVNLSDRTDLNSTFHKYQELLKPVYLANGTSNSTVNRITGNDISGFQAMLDKIIASKSYKSIDLRV